MDFVSGFPRTSTGHDSIWVIVDWLTKSAHFIPYRTGWSVEKMTQLYVKEIVRLHGVSVSIVSDWDSRYMSQLWVEFQKSLGSQLDFSTAYHPQIGGHTERVN